MGERELAAALTEVTGVLRAVGIGGNRVTVLTCDAAVHTVRAVSSVEQVVLAGGGGTDMRVGIDQALRAAFPPDVVIVLTDGYTPWPAHPPQTARIVAGMIGSSGSRPADPPPWITCVTIPTEPPRTDAER